MLLGSLLPLGCLLYLYSSVPRKPYSTCYGPYVSAVPVIILKYDFPGKTFEQGLVRQHGEWFSRLGKLMRQPLH